MWREMEFTYPSGPVTVTRESWEGRLCGGCGGRKSPNTGRCWRCAGQPEPVRRTDDRHLGTRALHALFRNHPAGEHDEAKLLMWAATLPDKRLLRMRNVGAKVLTWIRANQPQMDAISQGLSVTVVCPTCHGSGEIVATIVAQSPETTPATHE